MKTIYRILKPLSLLIAVLFLGLLQAKEIYSLPPFTIGIVKYHNGDWYSCLDGVQNFLNYIQSKTDVPCNAKPVTIDLMDTAVFQYPFLLMNGHGPLQLDQEELQRLRQYLTHGGFLLVNDDYGLDPFVRKLVKELFPEQVFKKLPNDHPIFRSFYNFPKGLPKIHEHDNKPAEAWGIFLEGRLVLLYLFETDIVDGWEKESVHHDPETVRLQALRFGINIVWYVLMH